MRFASSLPATPLLQPIRLAAYALTIFTAPLVFAGASEAQTKFQKGLNYAKSQDVKNTLQKSLADFKPQEALKSKNGAYTDNPAQANYYSETQSNTYDLEKASREEITKDDNSMPTPGKAVMQSAQSRPVVKITGKEEFMQKGKLINDNAKNIIMGESNKHINCEKQKLSACKIVQIEKTCNEAIPIQKICEKVAVATTSTNDITYHGCKKVAITQATWNYCPHGYNQILYSDMIRFESYDDIRICTKDAHSKEQTECLGGYLVRGIDGSRSIVQSTQRATVPKKMHGHIRFSNFFDGGMVVTIVNETTGQTLYNSANFTNGQVIELPFSASQDQVFRFYEPECAGGGGGIGRFFRCMHGRGVMVLYIDHIAQEKVASVSWKELPCYYAK